MNRIPPIPEVFRDCAPISLIAESFREDVVAGLSAARKTLPCKYFYDDTGCQLFEAICRTPEYYPTRVETALLRERAGDIADIAGPSAQLIEFGGSSSAKARILLDAMDEPAAYVPIDVCTSAIYGEIDGLRARYPGLDVRPVTADFTNTLDLSDIAAGGKRVGFFPGSTIGNFTPDQARAFLRRVAGLLGRDGIFIVGVDLKKDRRILEAAYNDAAGVTAAFNLNLLRRINRELRGNFDVAAFSHLAHYNTEMGRIEMRLYSTAFQTARVGGQHFAFSAGESIHTENSYKYAPDEFTALAREAGYAQLASWSDPARNFSLYCLAAGGVH